MKVGVVKEIKDAEKRVGLIAQNVSELTALGQSVFVQQDCGLGIGQSNETYKAAGAKILSTAKEVYDTADIIIKVKEPQPNEAKMIREDQIIFCYLHLAPDPVGTKALLDSRCRAIAIESITSDSGALPLLLPMSEIAGRMSVQIGAHFLESSQGGSGKLLSGAVGVSPAKVVVIGCGVSGRNAIHIAHGMEADVTAIDINLNNLSSVYQQYGNSVKTIYSTENNINQAVKDADLVILAVLIPDQVSPKVLTKDMVKNMQAKSVIVDIAIDQGGSSETSRPTSHSKPTYIDYGVIHYAVPNIPGIVAHTASSSLNNSSIPFIKQLVTKGFDKALAENNHLANGLNLYLGKVVNETIAKAHNMEYYKFKN